jgi:hypothetical protein
MYKEKQDEKSNHKRRTIKNQRATKSKKSKTSRTTSPKEGNI